MVLGEDFPTPIAFDTPYTLSMEFRKNAKQIVFKCNSDTIVFDISTSIYPAYDSHRQLRTRIYADPGETGYLKTYFDDVYTEKNNPIMFPVRSQSGTTAIITLE